MDNAQTSCPNCGRSIKPGAKSCHKCGLVLDRMYEGEYVDSVHVHPFSVCCWVLAMVFFILTVVLLRKSAINVDKQTAEVIGVSVIANFQATIYVVGCVIASVIFIIGGFIIEVINRKH